MSYRKTYTVPADELALLADLRATYADARSPPDGHLASWIEHDRFERDGKRWVTVIERGQGWAVELALAADGTVTDVVALAPERAEALANGVVRAR